MCTYQYITAFNPLLWCNETDGQPEVSTLPDHVMFLFKKFLKPQSIKNLPIPTPTQIHVWNIAKATIIIRELGKMFGVMKPSMWTIGRGSNSRLHIIVATTYVNNRTAWQNAQRPVKQCRKQMAICYVNGDPVSGDNFNVLNAGFHSVCWTAWSRNEIQQCLYFHCSPSPHFLQATIPCRLVIPLLYRGCRQSVTP
jgi:hypothetical protein